MEIDISKRGRNSFRGRREKKRKIPIGRRDGDGPRARRFWKAIDIVKIREYRNKGGE
jgi:hypothetical protein